MSAATDLVTTGLDHRGLLYTDRASLVAATVPLITRALAATEDVVVVVDRATARELHGALGHADAARVLFPSPSAVVGGHGSPAFTRNLAGWASSRPDVRVLVVTQYAPGPVPDLDPSLAALPITVLCACSRGADSAVLRVFHDEHDVVTPGEPAPDPREAAALETVLGDTADLAGVRREVRQVAVAAGFRGVELERTVLAVHEVCALGYRLLAATGGDGTDPVRRCWVEVRTSDGTLRADVVVPGGAAPMEPPPPERDLAAVDADDDAATLARVRHFCAAASVHDGARSRAIRVLATAAP